MGLVERAQQTLIIMTRTADEGGAHWVDHLPFLLMSMRAVAGCVVPLSPAVLLYGRELRLPAQLSDPRPMAESTIDLSSSSVRTYAEELNSKHRVSWQIALDATRRS